MKSGKWYVKDTGDFLEKIKSIGRIPEDAFLVVADIVGLYPIILHHAGLKALYKKLEERSDKIVPSADLVGMAEFVLKKNFFEFDSKSNNKSLVLPLGQNLHHHTHTSVWIKLRLIF